MNGALVIDKGPGMTSHDVVDQVRKRLHTKRVGHGGTLDPDATGVLLIGVGKATRFLSYAQASPKRYEAVIQLGSATSTQDASGDVLYERPVTSDAEQLSKALERFRGPIEQIPPMVSAVRVGGKRLHELARAGQEVERQPRNVTIYELRLIDEDLGRSNRATLDVRCSGGTYVRTLAHDLGEVLGSGGHLVSLRRTEAAGFTLEDAISIDEVSEETLRPLVDVVHELPRLDIDAEMAALVANGRPLFVDRPLAKGTIAAVVNEGVLLGVYRSEGNRLVAERVVGQ
jgi:tRNA pseudouridine55 synthase